MKRIKILLILFFLATGFSVNAMNLETPHSDNNWQQHRDKDHRSGGGGCPIGAPLDGGLLTVLGVGGVAYYVARKKGKKPES